MVVYTTEDWLTNAQAARWLELSEARVRKLAADGILPCISTPLGRLYRVGDVVALVAERQGRRTHDERRGTDATEQQ